MAFNEAQKRAIRHTDGPALVLAGPGSGKTTVITNRVRYLTEKVGVEPGNILVITFTRAAAREMKERYERITGTGCSRVSFGTFHSVFFMILKLAYRYQASNIVKEEQRIQFIREQLDHTDLEIEDEGEFIASVLSEISLIKGELMSLDNYYAKSCSQTVLKSCMKVMKVVSANRDFWTLMTCLPCAMSFLKNVRIFYRRGRENINTYLSMNFRISTGSSMRS